jgi:hypothetical protein
MTKLNHLIFRSLLLFAVIGMYACGDDDSAGPTYTIPTTYNFENVSYSGQTQRLGMMSELKSYMATSRTMGTALDANRLAAMFANDSANAQWNGSYEDSKQIKSKTFESVQADFDALLIELAEASQSTVAGSEGVTGVIESQDGAKSYLIGADGLDHAQVVEKSLMGACFYYQSTAVYFGADRMNVDNEEVTPGKGTKMEHHWDEAFGYLGVPTDFPTNLDGLVFWGNYSNKRNSVLSCNQPIMDAMLKGRAAISNDDLTARDEAIEEARETWELISVGSALHYINSGMDKFDDKALSLHGLSEAIGFIYSLQFNPSAKVTNAQVSELLTLIAGSDKFAEMNLYNTTTAQLQEAKDKLAGYYSLEDKKDEF